MTKKEKQEIINLISEGFDIKLLSSELNIPTNIIKKLEDKLKASENNDENESNIDENNGEVKEKYKKLIKIYKEELCKEELKQGETGLIKKLNKRNLLAFAYFQSGLIDDARKELESLIREYSNFTAYRQLVHLEKTQGNMEDAKLWAYEALDKYPESVVIRKQLLSIAKQEKDIQEVIFQQRAIANISLNNKQNTSKSEEIGVEK